MKKIIFISLLALIFSCSSDDNEISNDATINSNYKLTKIKHYASLTTSVPYATTIYEYDEELRLSRRKKGSGEILSTYNYDDSNKLVSIEHNDSTITYYTYNNQDLIVSSSTVNNANQLLEYQFEYNELNQVIISRQYIDGNLQCEATLTYDEQNNIILRENTCVSYVVEFEYDNMNNPNIRSYSQELRGYFGNSNNNVTKVIIGNSSQTENFYEYNDQGYPTVVDIPGDQIGSRYRQEYTYESL